MSLNISFILIILTVFHTNFADESKTCLRKGCELTSGLQASETNSTIKRLLEGDEKFDNVLRVMSWNILSDKDEMNENSWMNRKEDLCEYLNTINPMIMGLQEVKQNQLDDLNLCLKEYSFVGSALNEDDQPFYSPLFYKQSRLLKLKASGTFWLSKTPNVPGSKLKGAIDSSVATWARLSFSQEFGNGNGRNGRQMEKIRQLLKIFTSKTEKEEAERNMISQKLKRRRRKSRTTNFYVVNTNLDWKNVSIAQQQVRILLHHLKNVVMDRRRYHVIMMGDLSYEDDSAMYEEVKRSRWVKNTMADARESLPTLTTVDMQTLLGKELVDYIWQSKFDPILSAVLIDMRSNARLYSDHRPVFAALKPV